ncbi:DUF5682 family protein [Actinoplanes rectilineatus]|uniref:DUF5682 family protein n=1 Tax=Actinoplanes rectilineatus TaxID=113571 RepID=UPI0005F292A6|nr:DUF5682 family protein [Actinoplanes rectilineatus]
MSLTVIGVRHHSPACARLVAATIRALRPAYVLIEGPSDMNGRIGEMLLGHELPVAVFTNYADGERRHGSWAPFCAYSPEWVALQTGHETGAELRFIDLPAWHEAFADRSNRYADAELRYAEAVDRLCTMFGVDNTDALWDHLVEMGPQEEIAERLTAYFDLIRGESAAGESDTAREAYMAGWLRAARAHAGDRPVVAVVGGFHRPALLRLAEGGPADWPPVPDLPAGAVVGSYLVPYSFRRLDAFAGYQSGMPSPEYYQQLWDHGPESAARHLVTVVAGRLRGRGHPVSTADLIAARTTAEALALLRGHPVPARVDVLDGLASALVAEALDVPLPWSVRGALTAGQHPAVVEMTAALSGARLGRLHPDTPLPPLVHAVTAELERHGLDRSGEITVDLLDPRDRERSRVLHRLRVMAIPGYARSTGPESGLDPALVETWTLRDEGSRLVALIEAGGYGATLPAAVEARLAERVAESPGDLAALAAVLFDVALSGVGELTGDVLEQLGHGVAAGTDLAELGRVLSVVLALWRHDELFGTAGTAALGVVVEAATRRILWLSDGLHGPGRPADPKRIRAVVAVRDAVLHGRRAGVLPAAAVEVAGRVAVDRAAPPDLRGAFYGLARVVAAAVLTDLPGVPGLPTPAEAVRGAFAGGTAGDWLAGLFGVARETVLAVDGMLPLLDDLISGFAADDFLVALPALRQAFEFFPPRERETIADRLLDRRGMTGSGRALLRVPATPEVVAAGMALDELVERRLSAAGLGTGER